MVGHRAVLVQRIALGVDLFGMRRDHLRRDLAHDLQDAAVVLHRFLRIAGRIVRSAVQIVEMVLLDQGQFFHVDLFEQELDIFVVEEEICHGAVSTKGMNSAKCGETSGIAPEEVPDYVSFCTGRSRSVLISMGITCEASPRMP